MCCHHRQTTIVFMHVFGEVSIHSNNVAFYGQFDCGILLYSASDIDDVFYVWLDPLTVILLIHRIVILYLVDFMDVYTSNKALWQTHINNLNQIYG